MWKMCECVQEFLKVCERITNKFSSLSICWWTLKSNTLQRSKFIYVVRNNNAWNDRILILSKPNPNLTHIRFNQFTRCVRDSLNIPPSTHWAPANRVRAGLLLKFTRGSNLGARLYKQLRMSTVTPDHVTLTITPVDLPPPTSHPKLQL